MAVISNKMVWPIKFKHPVVVTIYGSGNLYCFFIFHAPKLLHIVLVSLVDPRLLPYPPGSLFCSVKFHDHCDRIVVNLFLYLKVYSIIDPMGSVESYVRDVLDLLWWSPSSFPCSAKNCNTEVPCSNQHPREGK